MICMFPEETEWDYSESSVGLEGGVTWTSVGVFLDLGCFLFLEIALEALGPCDLGRVGVTVCDFNLSFFLRERIVETLNPLAFAFQPIVIRAIEPQILCALQMWYPS
ncbi:hypothetical protein Tco_1202197 [Tanacetum coccineum]